MKASANAPEVAFWPLHGRRREPGFGKGMASAVPSNLATSEGFSP